ncbi:YbaK/EbsC family protein [Streptomyces sp. YIM 98790]|uniref:YbaK/EbsC family protein n=1 Tax=Streptomyces sp. YIM 98790 TaxID=2689077 RepID=UPI00140C8482|nr:YbaK/EbsC family protein [Streptomyces sp. YIM 98790]
MTAPVQRLSRTLLRTLREAPADADTAALRLLVRAGYLRRTAPGLWSWLPLGRLLLDNVLRVVREELDAIGAQEVLLPEGGRAGRPAGLLAELVRDQCASYRDLPVTVHRIGTAHRDGPRPGGGLLRAREHLALDSLAFALGERETDEAYARYHAACRRILTRLAVPHRLVPALPGGAGEAYLGGAEGGDDTLVTCRACGHEAMTGAVTVSVPAADPAAHPPTEELDTPDTPTIGTLAAQLGVPASATLKNLLVTVDGEITAVGVPGDREVDMERLARHLAPAAVELVTAEDFTGRPDLVRGYIGPQGGMAGTAFRYLADPRVAPGTSWITGSNKPGRHARHVVCGRDFQVDRYLDVVAVRDGDPCPACGAEELRTGRAVEMARVARLGTGSGAAPALDVLGPDGRPARAAAVSWTLDLYRLVTGLAEATADEQGLCWPRAAAPAEVHIVAAGKAARTELALELAGRLAEAGVRVLVDDRAGVSPGVKFTDAELIGVPTLLIVGRGAAEGRVELKDRATGTREEHTTASALAHLTAQRRPAAPASRRARRVPPRARL